jgi:hypothetical protein
MRSKATPARDGAGVWPIRNDSSRSHAFRRHAGGRAAGLEKLGIRAWIDLSTVEEVRKGVQEWSRIDAVTL